MERQLNSLQVNHSNKAGRTDDIDDHLNFIATESSFCTTMANNSGPKECATCQRHNSLVRKSRILDISFFFFFFFHFLSKQYWIILRISLESHPVYFGLQLISTLLQERSSKNV